MVVVVVFEFVQYGGIGGDDNIIVRSIGINIVIVIDGGIEI